MGSDRSFPTGICLLEPWVTAADPHAGPKLEPDPVARREAAGPALPFHWPVASPGLVGRKGHILMSECPAISSSMLRAKAYITLDTHWRPSGWGQRVLGEVHWTSILVESQPAPWVHSPCSPIQSVSRWADYFLRLEVLSIEKICRLEMGEGTGMTGRDKPRHPRSPQSSQGKQERDTGKVQQQLVLTSKARCMGGNSGDVLRQHLLSAANVQSRSDRLALVGGACGGTCLLAQHLCLCFISCFIWEERNSVSF